MEQHYRACNLCEAACGLQITVEANRIVQIRGDEADPISRGYLCPKAVALQDLHVDPDRLRVPVHRAARLPGTGSPGTAPQADWHQIDWESAIDEVAERLVQIRQQHGPDSIAFYLGNPITHGWGPIILVPMLLSALGTRQRYSAASVDQQPQHLMSLLLYGSPLLLPVPDVDRTDLLLVLGGNPLVSNGSIMTAPNIRRRLQQLRARGGRLIVVDPRRTATAEQADQHVHIRPGTDVYLLAAMANVIWSEGLAKPAPPYVRGMDVVMGALAPCSPEAASPVTGIEPEAIRDLARQLASAERAAVYARLGVCQSVYGTTAIWLVHLLNIMTGRLDAPGGWMLSRPAFDLPVIGARTTDLIGYDRWRSRLHQVPEVAAEFPSVTLADEILTDGPGRIRALVMIAGNPVLSVPDGRHMDAALADLEFCASIDYYRNESNRHADVILPPTAVFERVEFDLVFPAVSVRNQVRWGPAVLQPGADARSDAQILMELLARIESRTIGRRRAALRDRLRRALLPGLLVDIGLRIGPWGLRSRKRLSLRKLKRHPHGLDLGPLTGCLPDRLMTKDRLIHLDQPAILADLPRVLAGLDHSNGDRLLLIGRRHLRSNNSWMHNLPRLMGGTNNATLQVHPVDAHEHGLRDGDQAELSSTVGSIRVRVAVTDEVMPGVVCLPHGWGHGQRGGSGWSVASDSAGPSVNDITDRRRYDPLSGNAAVTALPVRLRPIQSTPQDMRDDLIGSAT